MILRATTFVLELLLKQVASKCVEKTGSTILEKAAARLSCGDFPTNHTIENCLHDSFQNSVSLLAHHCAHPKTKGLADSLTNARRWQYAYEDALRAIKGSPLSDSPEAEWLLQLCEASVNARKYKRISLEMVIAEGDGHNIGRFLEGKTSGLYKTHLSAELMRLIDTDTSLMKKGRQPARFRSLVHNGNPGLHGEVPIPCFGDLVLIHFRERIKSAEKPCRAVLFNLITGNQRQLDTVAAQLKTIEEFLTKIQNGQQEKSASIPANWDQLWNDFQDYVRIQFATVTKRLDGIGADLNTISAKVDAANTILTRIATNQRQVLNVQVQRNVANSTSGQVQLAPLEIDVLPANESEWLDVIKYPKSRPSLAIDDSVRIRIFSSKPSFIYVVAFSKEFVPFLLYPEHDHNEVQSTIVIPESLTLTENLCPDGKSVEPFLVLQFQTHVSTAALLEKAMSLTAPLMQIKHVSRHRERSLRAFLDTSARVITKPCPEAEYSLYKAVSEGFGSRSDCPASDIRCALLNILSN